MDSPNTQPGLKMGKEGVTGMDIIALHNEKARKLEELDEAKRLINRELDALNDELIEYVKQQPLDKQAEIMGKMVDSNVTYSLFHELKKLYKLEGESTYVG